MKLRATLSFLIGLTVFVALGMASPAAAQDDATIEMARQRFREGVQFYDAREYEKARLAFLQAYALKPHPSVLLNLAQSELRADRPADAANHFAQYLRDNASAGDVERQEAELGFTAAKARAGELRIEVDADGAEISVDGQAKGKAPLPGPLYVEPGIHEIGARSGDRNTATRINAVAGRATPVRLRLSGRSADPDPAPIRPVLDEDEEEAEEPSEPLTGESMSGSVSTAGRKPFFEWLFSSPVAMVGAGVGVAGLGVGTIFAFSAKSEYDSAQGYADRLVAEFDRDSRSNPAAFSGSGPCKLTNQTRQALGSTRATVYDEACQQYAETVDVADQNKTIATVGFIVGGVSAVGTILYYFLDPQAKQTATTHLPWYAGFRPIATSSEQGLMLQGAF